LTSESTFEDTSNVRVARSIIANIESSKNTEIDGAALSEIKSQIGLLADLCNNKYLKDFPIEIVDTPIDTIYFETRSWYFSGLRLSNTEKFIVDTFEQLDRNSDDDIRDASTRCVDALLVLMHYINVMICLRFDHGLLIEAKKPLDDCSSSNNVVETSTHMVIGDDSNG
jgi:hypothetical protein